MRHLRITLAVCFPYDNSPWGASPVGVTGYHTNMHGLKPIPLPARPASGGGLEVAPAALPNRYQSTTETPPKHHRWNRAAGGLSFTQRDLVSVVRSGLFGDALEPLFDGARVGLFQICLNGLGACLARQTGVLGRIGKRPPTLACFSLNPLSIKEKKYHHKKFHGLDHPPQLPASTVSQYSTFSLLIQRSCKDPRHWRKVIMPDQVTR